MQSQFVPSKASANDVLLSLMKEVNINAKLQKELLRYAKTGKSIPYIPKILIKSVNAKEEEMPVIKSIKLPARPLQRTKSAIEKLGVYEREQFRPTPSKTRPSQEKEKLQNIMAFGRDIDEELRNSLRSKTETESSTAPVDLFDEVYKEIKERIEFFNEMSELGLQKKYIAEIQCQISLHLRELEKLDSDRAQAIIQELNM